MELRKYDKNQFAHLGSWVPDIDALLLFAGTDFSFPFTADQLSRHIDSFPDREFYYGIVDETPVAFGEIIPQESGNPRLGRLIVQPDSRGQGLGTQFIEQLIKRCKERFNCESVELYVIVGNDRAINCYLNLGFYFLEEEDLMPIFNGKQVVARKMRLIL